MLVVRVCGLVQVWCVLLLKSLQHGKAWRPERRIDFKSPVKAFSWNSVNFAREEPLSSGVRQCGLPSCPTIEISRGEVSVSRVVSLSGGKPLNKARRMSASIVTDKFSESSSGRLMNRPGSTFAAPRPPCKYFSGSTGSTHLMFELCTRSVSKTSRRASSI